MHNGDKLGPTLFVWFNGMKMPNQMRDRDRTRVVVRIISQDFGRRRRGPVMTVSLLKRGRVKLVLACPPKGKRKARLVFTLRNRSLVSSRPWGECGEHSSAGCLRTSVPSVYPCKVVTLAIRLFGLRGPIATLVVSPRRADSRWVRRAPTRRIRGPVRLHMRSRQGGWGALRFDSSLSLLSLASSPVPARPWPDLQPRALRVEC